MEIKDLNQTRNDKTVEDGLKGVQNLELLNLLNKINDELFKLQEKKEALQGKANIPFSNIRNILGLKSTNLFAPAKIAGNSYNEEIKEINKNIKALKKVHTSLAYQYDREQEGFNDSQEELEEETEFEHWD